MHYFDKINQTTFYWKSNLTSQNRLKFAFLQSITKKKLEKISFDGFFFEKRKSLTQRNLYYSETWECLIAKKMNFFIEDFSIKCNQIHREMRIWSHLLKKSLKGNIIFVQCLKSWCKTDYIYLKLQAVKPVLETLKLLHSCTICNISKKCILFGQYFSTSKISDNIFINVRKTH